MFGYVAGVVQAVTANLRELSDWDGFSSIRTKTVSFAVDF
jgi:hypothetical protein